MRADTLCVLLFMGVTTCAYVYYTFWTLALPFVDDDQVAVRSLFPQPHWAVALPAAAGATLCLVVAADAARILLTSPA